MINPWKTINSREIYKNDWIRLREDRVITPTGFEGIYGVVEAHPAIGIVPVTDDLETFLVGQYRYTLNTYSWEIPEGGGSDGESNLAAAKRELLEETGLTAEKWTYLDSLYTSNSFTNEIGHIFLAEELKEGRPAPDHTEVLSVKKLPLKEAYRMVLDFTIKDALAVIGIFRAYQFLHSLGRL
jgi:8-oxo-dGTP pyrophosphatase MutT (NUDIX family)